MVASGVPGPAPFEDFAPLPDAAPLFADADDDHAVAAYVLHFEGGDIVWTFDCRTVVPGEAVLLALHITRLADYAENLPPVQSLLTGWSPPSGPPEGATVAR